MGMIKKTLLKEFETTRMTKPVCCMKLKDKDRVVASFSPVGDNIFIATKTGYGLWFDINEIPEVGLKTSGVKSINLKDDDVVSVDSFDDELEYISIITEKGTGKRVRLTEFDKSSRAKRGLMILREVKSNPYKVLKAFSVNTKHMLGIKTSKLDYLKLTDLTIADRYSTGSNISKEKIIDAFISAEFESKKNLEEKVVEENFTEEILKEVPPTPVVKEVKPKIEKPKKEVDLKEIDDKLLTIEDFLNSD